MLRHSRQLLALYCSTALLLAGHGLQLTLLPLRASDLGWAPTEIGLTGTAYFAGFLFGCYFVPRLVTGVGHIRVFSAMTTLCSLALLGIIELHSVTFWFLLRFATGIGISGSYIVIESWLNEKSAPDARGRTMAFYTALVLVSMTIGQLFVSVSDPATDTPVILGVGLMAAAVLPLSLIRMQQPRRPRTASWTVRELARSAPAAFGTTLLAGLITSALYGLLPVAAVEMGYNATEATLFMMSMVAGGAVLQYPVGKVSDRLDRRIVLIGLGCAGLIAAALTTTLADDLHARLALIFIIGGTASAMYPLCLAHANDRLPHDFLAVGTTILFLNSLGSVVGPTVFALIMGRVGIEAYFFQMAAVFGIISIWALICTVRRSEPERQSDFVSVVRSSPQAIALDPREEVDAENEAKAQPSDVG